MTRRLLGILLSVALLAGVLVVPGVMPTAADVVWSAADKGEYAVLDACPTDTPLNVGLRPTQNTTTSNYNSNNNGTGVVPLSGLTDGKLDGYAMLYQADTSARAVWDHLTFTLDAEYMVDRLFIASQAAPERHVWVKFYASMELATLYDDANLLAEKDNLADTELNVMFKGTAKKAKYIGVSIYIPDHRVGHTDATKYANITNRGGQMRFRELAVYGKPITSDVGTFEALTAAPDETPINAGVAPTKGVTTTKFGLNTTQAAQLDGLTDGKLDAYVMVYNDGGSTREVWEQLTFALDKEYTVDRLFVSSQAAPERHVWVKFYASTELATLYDDANLVASKDKIGVTELNFLLKGEAKSAKYVGVATYIPNHSTGTTDATKYPDITNRGGQMRFRELAVYEQSAWQAGDKGQYAVSGVVVPTGTALNAGVHPTKNTTTTKYANSSGAIALLTDGSLETGGKMFYQAIDGSKAVWENMTFDLGTSHNVESLYFASENASTRHVWVKFYASTDLNTLYDDANLMAEKDGFAPDELHVLMKGTAKQAQYVGFATYIPDTATDKTKYPEIGARASQIRFKELAVFAAGEGVLQPDPEPEPEPTDVGEFSVLTAVPTDVPANFGLDAYRGITTTKACGGSKLTDGSLDATQNIYLTVDNSKGVWEQLTFELTDTYMIDRLFVASEQTSTRHVFVQLYAAEELATLYDKANLIAAKDNIGETELNFLLKGTAKKAKYVGIATYVPDRSVDTQYTGLGAIASQMRFRELAVYGTVLQPPKVYFDETVVKAEGDLPTDKNLLKGEGVANKPAATLQVLKEDGVSPWNASQSASQEGTIGFDFMADDLITGINTTEANVFTVKDYSARAFVYDLRGTVNIDKLLIASDKASGKNYFVNTVEVYVSDDADTLLDEESFVQTLTFTVEENVKVFNVKDNEAVKGRYIAFKPNYCQYFNARFNELGVYGTYENGPRGFDQQMIQGKTPVKVYYAPMNDAGTAMDTINTAVRADKEYDILTDGKTNELVQFNLQTALSDAGGDQGWEWGTGGLLQQGVPWLVMVYYLDGTVNVNSITLHSSEGLPVAGVDYYVGDRVATLFAKENLVYTTNGSKTAPDKDGVQMLDPAYDDPKQVHQADLFPLGGKEGRYVAVVVTCPYATGRQGWGFARLSEVEVGGIRVNYDPPFTDDKHIWTDPATGIKADLSRLDNDDTEFFDNIGSFKVVKQALSTTLARTFDKEWLSVEGDYSYTIQLWDKAGNLITDEVMGDRYWKLYFPNESGQFRMMGLLKNDAITRVRHSYTTPDEKTVLVGNDYQFPETVIKGNNLSFVYLKYSTLSHIEKEGGMGKVEFTPYITAGAASSPAAVVWLWTGLAVAILAAGAVVVATVRRRRVKQ